ncbi:MAG: bestrophin family protein [Synechococcales cyanobacterium]
MDGIPPSVWHQLWYTVSMITNNYQWFHVALQTTGSVVPKVFPRALLFGILGFLVSILHSVGVPVAMGRIEHIVPSIVLGLLLVFRTNTAYERFWEGRKIWGTVVNTTRNLARKIWVFVTELKPGDRSQKIAVLRLLVAFSVAMKLHLRQESLNQEIEGLVSVQQYAKLQWVDHPALELAFWMNDYLHSQQIQGNLHPYEMVAITQLLNQLVDCLGACERILKTPIPLAYSIHLKQLLLLYCFFFPFQMVSNLGWLTGLFTTLTSFALLGIEEIGVEIENPFGRDANDLPLDGICEAMGRHVEDLISLSPSSCHWLDGTGDD